MSKKIIKTILLFISGLFIISSFKLKADLNEPLMIKEASIEKTTTKTSVGLRFFSTLNDFNDQNEHGFYLIYGKATVNELTYALNNNNKINGKKIFKIPIKGVDENNNFSVILINIPEKGYLDIITVISYIKKNNNVYYSEPYSTSKGLTALNEASNDKYNDELLSYLNTKIRVGFNSDNNLVFQKGIYENDYKYIIEQLTYEWMKYFDLYSLPTLNEITNDLDDFLNNNLKWDWLISYFSSLTEESVKNRFLSDSFYNFIYEQKISTNSIDFTDKQNYENISSFNNKVVVNNNKYDFYTKGEDITLPKLFNDDIGYYILDNKKYYPGDLINIDDNNLIFETIVFDNITSIKTFLTNDLDSSYIKGVISSFGEYNTISIFDDSGAVAVSFPNFTTNDLIALGYNLGDEILVKVIKNNYNGLIQAEVIDEDITKVTIDNKYDNAIDLNNKSLDNLNLYQYMSKLITIDDFVISKITQTEFRFEFRLSNKDKNILLIIDKRLTTINLSSVDEFKEGDVIKLNKALLSWDNGPQLIIDNLDDITKTSEVNVDEDGIKNYNIFYLNDTHGAILNDGSELGMARIGNYIKNNSNQNSIFVTGGDMLQGQLISNSNKGALMIEIFNELNLDAFVIGNHEFDWGLDVILQYFDPNTTGVKANFPILGANVVEKKTNQRPDFIDSHIIINRGKTKIGIIGVIGDGLESSIAYSRVKDYEFTNAYQAVNKTVNQIKDEVDFIIVVNHASNNNFNTNVSLLPKVAAIFNGHTHRNEIDEKNNVPVLQSGGDGRMVGEVTLTFEKTGYLFNLIDNTINNISYDSYLNTPDETIEGIINKYYEDIYPLYEDVIITASKSMSQDQLAYFISRLMKETTNSVAGFQNKGGTRATLSNNQEITAADIYQITPFENQIIVVEVNGYNLKRLLSDTYFFITSDLNERDIDNNKMYQIATNDYIYYSDINYSIFNSSYGTEIEFGDMYEVFYQTLLNLKHLGYQTFDTNSPIIYNLDDLNTYILTKKYLLLDERRYTYIS